MFKTKVIHTMNYIIKTRTSKLILLPSCNMVGMKKLLNISKITMKLGAAVPYSHNNFKVFFKVFHSNLINPNILKLDRHINSDVFFRKIWFILL